MLGRRCTIVWWTTMSLVAMSCGRQDDPAGVNGRAERLVDSPCEERVIPWGDALGFVPGGEDFLPRGPQAIALGRDGRTYVLDTVNERVVAFDEQAASVVTAIEPDAEDLVVGTDGTLAIYSELRATVWVHREDGARLGELSVPRILRGVTGIEAGTSRRVFVRNAHQERFALGSPALPLDVASILRSRREGAFLATNGDGLRVTIDGDRAKLEITVGDGAQGRTEHRATYSLPGRASAARIIGVASNVACIGIEAVEDGVSGIEVVRRIACVDLDSGTLRFEIALPPRGVYEPRTSLAIGGSPLRIGFLSPSDSEMRITTCEVGR